MINSAEQFWQDAKEDTAMNRITPLTAWKEKEAE
jgi:hypothetical protein